MAEKPLRQDYTDAHKAAKAGDLQGVLRNLLAQEIRHQSDLGVSEVGDKRMSHVYQLIDRLQGYETPAMSPTDGSGSFPSNGVNALETWVKLGSK